MAVVTTAPDAATAAELATGVVEERLAACANIFAGVTSIYWWEGEVQRDQETLVVFKTGVERIPALRDRIVELHPYDVPEVLVVPVPGGSKAYLDWVRDEVAPR